MLCRPHCMNWQAKSTLVPLHTMKPYRGNGGLAPLILNLGTRWRWAVNCTPRPLYPRPWSSGLGEKNPLFTRDRTPNRPAHYLDNLIRRFIWRRGLRASDFASTDLSIRCSTFNRMAAVCSVQAACCYRAAVACCSRTKCGPVTAEICRGHLWTALTRCGNLTVKKTLVISLYCVAECVFCNLVLSTYSSTAAVGWVTLRSFVHTDMFTQ